MGMGTLGRRDVGFVPIGLYGAFTLKSRPPRHLCVMHLCNNPPCCNPAHLELGTYAENMQYCVASGRHSQANRGTCSNGHPFDEENTRLYRRKDGGIERKCRVCNCESSIPQTREQKDKRNARWRDWYARNRERRLARRDYKAERRK